MWLNEGFTVFVERKIIGRMKSEQERHFQAIGEYIARLQIYNWEGGT